MLEDLEHIDIRNMHHAYLIEGERAVALQAITAFIAGMGIAVINNPDFSVMLVDAFKIDDAIALRQMGSERSLNENKKIFITSANSFTLDAQQALLKLFEEPIDGTHFFVIVPEADALIKTLLSRFHVIRNKNSARQGLAESNAQAARFITMPIHKRIDFIKDLLADGAEEKEGGLVLDSARSTSLRFLNALEKTLRDTLLSKGAFDKAGSGEFFQHIFKVREFLRQPGSATKTLLESVALIVPIL